MKLLSSGGAALILLLSATPTSAQDFGRASVFEYVVRSATGSVDSVADALAAEAGNTGLTVVARLEAAAPASCDFESRVLVLYDAEYASSLRALASWTYPFAALDRINVFRDEAGVHVSIVNPMGINRTVLMKDTEATVLSAQRKDRLRTLVSGAVAGTASDRFYGPSRDRGYIGRTMGVMAGGPFNEKMQVIGSSSEALAATVTKLKTALASPGPEWGLHVEYEVALPGGNAVLLGLSGTGMESKSFDIVGSGSDDTRDKLACPGLAHAAAYPLELLVTRRDNRTDVVLVDAMYRMKMYFEDAGKWAFMKNMGMPGSIAGEIKNAVESALGAN